MKFSRQLKYYYLRFIRLRGSPDELALGIAFGVFVGMMPIMPFQIALAVTLAIFFKGSKITAALGTWISNPFNWYFLYFFSYKIGAMILGLSEKHRGFSTIMESVRHGEEAMTVIGKLASASGSIMAAFLLGGFVMGFIVAIPSYFIFLWVFRIIRDWREARRHRKQWQRPDQ